MRYFDEGGYFDGGDYRQVDPIEFSNFGNNLGNNLGGGLNMTTSGDLYANLPSNGTNYFDYGAGSQQYSPSSFEPVNNFGQTNDLGFTNTGENLTYGSPSSSGIDWSGLGSKALGALGSAMSGTTFKDLASAGLGGLALANSIKTGQFDRDMLKRQFQLSNDIQRGNLGLNERKQAQAENQFRVNEGLDSMASKALGMQLLVNRGRMTADQTNPWLNFMFTGRQQMFGNDPVIGNAYATRNPMNGYGIGQANLMPHSTNEFFRGLDPSANMSVPVQQKASGGLAYAGGGSCDCGMNRGGALGLLAGGSAGQADDVNARLSHGEYVMDADTVSALGDGNTEAGAARLDNMRANIRQHKRSAPKDQIPPKAKDPMKYLGGK